MIGWKPESEKWDPTGTTVGALNWGQFWDDTGLVGATTPAHATNFNFIGKNSNSVTWADLVTNAAKTEGTFEDFLTKAKAGQDAQTTINGYLTTNNTVESTTSNYDTKLTTFKSTYKALMLKKLKAQFLTTMA